MFLERIEQELADALPWEVRSVNRFEWDYQIRDCWEIESREKKAFSHNFLIFNVSKFIFLRLVVRLAKSFNKRGEDSKEARLAKRMFSK